jgi:type II secretory pathway component PulM
MMFLDTLKLRWLSLSPRERVLLGTLVPVVLCGGIYLGLIEPLAREVAALETARTARVAAVERLAALAAEADALRSRVEPGATRTPLQGSLLATLDETARAAGLGPNIERIVPAGGDAANVVLRAAPQAALLAWLTGLENNAGITVSRGTLDRAEAPGLVNASLDMRVPN